MTGQDQKSLCSRLFRYLESELPWLYGAVSAERNLCEDGKTPLIMSYPGSACKWFLRNRIRGAWRYYFGSQTEDEVYRLVLTAVAAMRGGGNARSTSQFPDLSLRSPFECLSVSEQELNPMWGNSKTEIEMYRKAKDIGDWISRTGSNEELSVILSAKGY